MLGQLNKKIGFRVISLVIVVSFVFSNIADASMLSAYKLRTRSDKNLDGGKEIGNELAFLNEKNKTVAEATSANIGKFLKPSYPIDDYMVTAELTRIAKAELQKLVNAGLLTNFRVVIEGQEMTILTTRQNKKAVEDSGRIPAEILKVYLAVLDQAKEQKIYQGEDLTNASFTKQWKALEISVPVSSLKYSAPESWAKSFLGRIKTELKVPEGQSKEFFTNVIHSYSIADLLAKPIDMIPDEVVDAIKERLKDNQAHGTILSSDVKDFGGTDIQIHVTHRFGELNAAVHKEVILAMREGVFKAQQMGLLKKEVDILKLSLDELSQELSLMPVEHSISERGSEPVEIAKIIGGSIGAANIKLFHEFAIEGSTPLKKLGLPSAPGFRFIVRRTKDILEGNAAGQVWEFEISSERTVKGMHYPSKNQGTELLALASQPNDYQITAVYPVEGSKLPVNEPIATVLYQPVYKKGKLRALNPTIVFKSQSGVNAVGGIATTLVDANFVPGGDKGKHYVVTKPVSLQEARKAPQKGFANIAIYGYMSEENGVFHPEEIGDFVGRNPQALGPERRRAKILAKIMGTHQYDQPFIAPFAAQEQVEGLRKEQTKLFTRAPKEADIDTMMDEVEAKVASGEYLAISDDKADMGGDWGHEGVPKYMLAVYRATLMEAKEKGGFSDGNIIGAVDFNRLAMGKNLGIGDDGHMLMVGDTSRNNAEAHQLSFLAFTRAYLAAKVGGKKPYGLGQDYQGKEAKAAMANPYFYSQLNERFFEILKQVMPIEYMVVAEKLEKGWKEWQVSKKEEILPQPFSGNVSQQGIGTARYVLDIAGGERTFRVLAGDKMGPAALNRPIREGVFAALAAGKFQNGLVFEIWDAKAFDEHGNIPLDELPELYADIADAIGSLKEQADQDFVKNSYADGKLKNDLADIDKAKLAKLIKQAGFVPTKRIFLDATQNKEAIYKYLADSDRFNIKQVWNKKNSGWDINNPKDYLNKPVLGSSVTKLGILAGGEYIGKDDPVMVGHSDLMEYIHEFLRTNYLIIQGDMNGSHWLGAVPIGLKYAIATKDSHPILVGLKYTMSEDGKTLTKVEDIFAGKNYSSMRRRIHEFNFLFKKAQLDGQWEPYGTNVLTVESSYPLAKSLRDIAAEKSVFLVKNKPEAEKRSRTYGIGMDEMIDVQKTAVGTLSLPSAPEGWSGAAESAQRYYQSLLYLQSAGVNTEISENAFNTAKDSAHKKVILISSQVLRSDPSIILAVASANTQLNQRLGVFGSDANIAENAFEFYFIADEPGLETVKDVENLFAGIAKQTNNGIVPNKAMFKKIVTQEDMAEGKITNAADLGRYLGYTGIKQELVEGLIGPKEWTKAIKDQGTVQLRVISANTDAESNKVAFAANALFGLIEAIATPDRQLTDSLAKKLELIQEATDTIVVTSKEINTNVVDEITSYREVIGEI